MTLSRLQWGNKEANWASVLEIHSGVLSGMTCINPLIVLPTWMAGDLCENFNCEFKEEQMNPIAWVSSWMAPFHLIIFCYLIGENIDHGILIVALGLASSMKMFVTLGLASSIIILKNLIHQVCFGVCGITSTMAW